MIDNLWCLQGMDFVVGIDCFWRLSTGYRGGVVDDGRSSCGGASGGIVGVAIVGDHGVVICRRGGRVSSGHVFFSRN